MRAEDGCASERVVCKSVGAGAGGKIVGVFTMGSDAGVFLRL